MEILKNVKEYLFIYDFGMMGENPFRLRVKLDPEEIAWEQLCEEHYSEVNKTKHVKLDEYTALFI